MPLFRRKTRKASSARSPEWYRSSWTSNLSMSAAIAGSMVIVGMGEAFRQRRAGGALRTDETRVPHSGFPHPDKSDLLGQHLPVWDPSRRQAVRRSGVEELRDPEGEV